MKSRGSLIPIDERQLALRDERAGALLVSVSWMPSQQGKRKRPDDSILTEWIDPTFSMAKEDKLSLIETVKCLTPTIPFLSEDATHVLHALRQGLRLGMHMSGAYANASGLETLAEMNDRKMLPQSRHAEFSAKYVTAAAVAQFVAASFIVWQLSRYRMEDVGKVTMDFGGIPEFSFQSPARSLQCMMYYYAAYVAKSGAVKTDLELVKLTILFFQAVIDEVKVREESLEYTEYFTAQSYKLTDSDFVIDGFNVDRHGGEVSIEFNHIALDAIVGNREPKHKVLRLAQRLVCYDPAIQRNVIADLGGLSTLILWHGRPGTGKSMLIAAAATLIDEYCRMLELPFLFWPLPDTIISTFQGGSAERMESWMRVLRDPTKIIFAPIDDAENVFEDRTRNNVSAGVREALGVFLRNTEGAYAIDRGNTVKVVATNLPDQLDPAVLSRIIDGVHIGGAESREDFLDQDYLWWRKYEELDPQFVDMKKSKGYVFLETQKQLNALSELYANVPREPVDARLRQLFAAVRKLSKTEEHAFFAEFFLRVKESYPFFTSRDVRNIQRAVDERLMDFDLPGDWFEQPERFFRKEYDEKKAMVVELMRQTMKGLSFAEVKLQETIRYLDNTIQIQETARQRRLNERIEALVLEHKAIQGAAALWEDSSG